MMRNRLGTVLVGLAMVVPAGLHAQRARQAAMASPKHEFGVDLILGYQLPKDQPSGFGLGTPVDVRVGFVSEKAMSFEGRLALGLSSGFGGGTTYTIDPGVNLLFRLGQGTMTRNRYFTFGADVAIQDIGANSGAVFGVNGGIGMRKPYGNGAWRCELFGEYDFENNNLGEPGTFSAGLRLGLSLWH